MATNNYADDIEALRTDLKLLQSDIATLTKNVTTDMRNGAQNVAADVSATGQEGLTTVSKTVRENPFASIAAAAGVGFVIGALLRRS